MKIALCFRYAQTLLQTVNCLLGAIFIKHLREFKKIKSKSAIEFAMLILFLKAKAFL